METGRYLRCGGVAALLLISGAILSGCPTTPQGQYDVGFAAGFAKDDEYWTGFKDSYDTINGGTIYYAGDTIPNPTSPDYDAGYYDGLWYAYNDGYFVEYDYAFTIGFSEGYDIGFDPDGINFLHSDPHVEFADGGFDDGYNDGFSEGSVFGAYDYNNSIAYDWFGAMKDYRKGTDVTIGGVSTGKIALYTYGTDPKNPPAKDARAALRIASGFTIRSGKEKAQNPDYPGISYRPLTTQWQNDFDVTPTTSPRGQGITLRLTTSWLDRILQYKNSLATTKAVTITVNRGS